MEKRDFNLRKAIVQGYAWTIEGKKVVFEHIYFGAEIYPIVGTVFKKSGIPESRQTWTLTGKWVKGRSDMYDLTTKEP